MAVGKEIPFSSCRQQTTTAGVSAGQKARKPGRPRKARAGFLYRSAEMGGKKTGSAALLAQAEPFDQGTVAVGVLALQIIQQLAALANHLKQASPGVMILGIGLEVAGEAVDAGGQQGHLHFGGTGITLGTLVFGENLRLVCGVECHLYVTLSLF